MTERTSQSEARWDTWQRYEASDSVEQNCWFAATWHLERLASRHPDDINLKSQLHVARTKLEQERPKSKPRSSPGVPEFPQGPR
jgi:hypothetical protein